MSQHQVVLKFSYCEKIPEDDLQSDVCGFSFGPRSWRPLERHHPGERGPIRHECRDHYQLCPRQPPQFLDLDVSHGQNQKCKIDIENLKSKTTLCLTSSSVYFGSHQPQLFCTLRSRASLAWSAAY